MSTLITCTSSTRPSSPSTGDILYETDTYQTIIYDGSAWKEFPSTSSPYDLDGTNTVSSRPIWHFDAAKINGVDASGNPSNAASLTTAWKSLSLGEGAMKWRFAPQATSSYQPTWYSTGENDHPYLDWDGGDSLLFETGAIQISGPFCWFQVMKSDASQWTGMNGTSYGLFTRRANDILYYYSSTSSGYNSGQNTYNLDSLSNGTKMLLFEKSDTTNPSWLHVNGDNGQGNTGSGASAGRITFTGFGTGLSGNRPNGKVYEMALWVGEGINATTSPLTATDKNSLIDYVETKYDLSGFVDF